MWDYSPPTPYLLVAFFLGVHITRPVYKDIYQPSSTDWLCEKIIKDQDTAKQSRHKKGMLKTSLFLMS